MVRMEMILLGAAAALLTTLGIIVLVIALRKLLADDIAPRLNTYVTEQDVETKRWREISLHRTRDLSGSMMTRLILPAFRRVGELLSRLAPSYAYKSLRQKLYIAGNPLGLGAREFSGIRVAFIILGIALSLFLLSRGINQQSLVFSLAILTLCIIFPILWLRMLVSSRQNIFRRGLPDALDMLSVCVDSGLGFDQAMQRMCEQWKTPIALEFNRVVNEMEMGLSRVEALRNLAERLDVPELSSFVAVIIQSDKLGMSIADTLHAQADQMRVERRFHAQEIARTIPIKMLIPLAFLIFPAILAMLLGPSIPAMVELFSSF